MLNFNPILSRNSIIYKVGKSEEISYNPPLYSYHQLNSYHQPSASERLIEELKEIIDPQPIKYYNDCISRNLSCCEFSLVIQITGNNVIEDFKLNFHLSGEIRKIGITNKQDSFLDLAPKECYTFIREGTLHGVFDPMNNILVQNDKVLTDKICFRPSENSQTVLLEWELIARDFTTNGKLAINIYPEIIDTQSTKLMGFHLPAEVRIENYYEYE